MEKLHFIVGILVLLLIGCTKEPIDPGVAILISPSNDETCFDGSSLNDTQSNVSFSWSTAENAISYELIVSDLLTQSSLTYTTNTNQTTIALTKAKPYSWQVKSIGEPGSNVIDSESWKFYLAGDAVKQKEELIDGSLNSFGLKIKSPLGLTKKKPLHVKRLFIIEKTNLFGCSRFIVL